MSYWDWLPLEIQEEVWSWEKKLKMNEVIRELEAQQNYLELLKKKSMIWEGAIMNDRDHHTVMIGKKAIVYVDYPPKKQPHEVKFWDKNLYSHAYVVSGPKEFQELYQWKWIDHDGKFDKNAVDKLQLYLKIKKKVLNN